MNLAHRAAILLTVAGTTVLETADLHSHPEPPPPPREKDAAPSSRDAIAPIEVLVADSMQGSPGWSFCVAADRAARI